MNEEKIRSYVRSILNEQEQNEKPRRRGPTKKKGKAIKPGEIGLSVGGGAFTKVVADVGALATKNPKQLMKNLEIKQGGNGLQGVINVWKQASSGTAPMQRAFGGLSVQSKGERKGLEIGLGELNARNGAKFVHHTLKGAMAAGILSSDVPLQVQVVGDSVIVHTGSKKGDWE